MSKGNSSFNTGIGGLFTMTLGYTIEFLIDNHSMDYSSQEISVQCGVSKKALDSYIIPSLLEKSIIHRTRKIGKVGMYKLTESDTALLLMKLHIELVKQ